MIFFINFILLNSLNSTRIMEKLECLWTGLERTLIDIMLLLLQCSLETVIAKIKFLLSKSNWFWNTDLMWFWGNGFSQKVTMTLADLRGGRQGRAPPPPGVQILSFSCSFQLKIRKIIGFWELAPPPGENPRSATAWSLSLTFLLFRGKWKFSSVRWDCSCDDDEHLSFHFEQNGDDVSF